MDLLTQMATFVRVVEGRSLSAAARAAQLSLPAVSRQLSALEADLGTPLVVRSTRRLHITEAGQRWYEHCQRVLRDVESARDDLRSSKSAHGKLVVSASLTYGMTVIAPRLPKLVEKHPHLAIDLRLEDQLVDLVGEGVDVAIRAGTPPPDSANIVAHRVAVMERILVASPRLLRRHGTPRTPSDVTKLPMLVQVTPSGATVPWAIAERGGAVHTVETQARLRSNAPITLRELAADGAGVAFLPSWVVVGELRSGRLRRILPSWTSPPITAYALFRTELRGAPRLRAFLEVLPALAPVSPGPKRG